MVHGFYSHRLCRHFARVRVPCLTLPCPSSSSFPLTLDFGAFFFPFPPLPSFLFLFSASCCCIRSSVPRQRLLLFSHFPPSIAHCQARGKDRGLQCCYSQPVFTSEEETDGDPHCGQRPIRDFFFSLVNSRRDSAVCLPAEPRLVTHFGCCDGKCLCSRIMLVCVRVCPYVCSV